MSTRSGPAANTCQFARMQSDAGLTGSNAAGDAQYDQDGLQRPHAINLYDNNVYDPFRPLSPSMSMYDEAQLARRQSANASVNEITLNNEGLPQAATVVSGQGAGLAAVLSSMQQQLSALTLQLNAMQQASISANANASQHANASCMRLEDAGTTVEPTMPTNDAIQFQFVPNAAQNAQIGITDAQRNAAGVVQGNMHTDGMQCNAPKAASTPQLHANAMHLQNMLKAMRDGGMAAGSGVNVPATVPRVPDLPNVPAMSINAAQNAQMQQHDGMQNYNAATNAPMMQNAPNVAMLGNNAAVHAMQMQNANHAEQTNAVNAAMANANQYGHNLQMQNAAIMQLNATNAHNNTFMHALLPSLYARSTHTAALPAMLPIALLVFSLMCR